MPGSDGHFTGHPVNLRFHLGELGIHAGLHAQDGAAEHKQVAHDDNGAAADFAKGMNEKQAHGSDGHAVAEAGDGNSARELGVFYALFLRHGLADNNDAGKLVFGFGWLT